MNLTPPLPSQNSHAVRWHCTAESKRRVAEIIIIINCQAQATRIGDSPERSNGGEV